MKKVEIYTTPFCPYCDRAKALLRKKGDRLWHTDSSFTRERTTYSLLLALLARASGEGAWAGVVGRPDLVDEPWFASARERVATAKS